MLEIERDQNKILMFCFHFAVNTLGVWHHRIQEVAACSGIYHSVRDYNMYVSEEFLPYISVKLYQRHETNSESSSSRHELIKQVEREIVKRRK